MAFAVLPALATGPPDPGFQTALPAGYATPPAGGYGGPPAGAGYGTPPGVMGCGGSAQMPVAPSTGLPFSPQELEYYQLLFSYADPEGKGVLEGAACANFLYGSGLNTDILHKIWEISDRQERGFLNAEGFFVALRLVAHAQANRPPDPQLVTVEPPALPDFPNIQRRRAPSELSPPPGSATPSVCGGAGGSDFSELQPVIAGEEEQVRRAAHAAARHASRSKSPKPFLRERWAPSRREKRKYASLFQRTDSDGDGYVLGTEAQVLLERSRLSREQLMVAWEHSDRDHDGRLDFREFVCLVHIVTCILRGAQQPGPAEELPIELVNSLTTLEPLEQLAAEREASRSRSASPVPSHRGDSPAFPPRSPRDRQTGASAWTSFGGEHEPTSQLGAQLFEESTSSAMPAFPAPPPDPDPLSGSKDAFGAFEAQTGDFGNDVGFGFGSPDEGKKDKKKDKRGGRKKRTSGGFEMQEDFTPPSGEAGFPMGTEAEFGELGGGQDPFTTQLAGGFASGPLEDPFTTQPPIPPPPLSSTDLGIRTQVEPLDPVQTQRQVSAAVSQFEAVASADQQVSRQLRREVDELDAELRRAQDAHSQLERQIQLEQEESERLERERRRLEGLVRQAQQRFAALQEERRGANLESLSLRRDRGHFVEETAFLRRMTTDEEGTLEVLKTANAFLERSQKELEAQTDGLERERKDVLRLASKEKELVQQAHRHNAELKNRLDRLKRERAAAVVGRQEATLREERVRDMQNHGVLPRTADGRPMEPTPSTGKHTWAPSLLTSPPPATAALASSGPGSGLVGAKLLSGSASAGTGAFHTAPPRAAALGREGV